MKYRDLLKKIDNFKDFEEESVLFLIEEIENIKRSECLLKIDEEIDEKYKDSILLAYDKYVNDHIPVQYILNKAYFYNEVYYVDKNVLIPRFDSEILVDSVVEYINDNNLDNFNIVDVGCGSGCLAVSIRNNIKSLNVSFDAIDISYDALMVAKKNIDKYGLNINVLNNDLLEGINKKYDIIVSNPPYISEDSNQVMGIVRDNEPHLALFSKDNGLYHYKKIIDQSLNCLKNNGIMFFEIDDNSYEHLKDYCKDFYREIDVIKDYNGHNRVLILRK